MRTTIVSAVAALALMGAGALTVPAAYADQNAPSESDGPLGVPVPAEVTQITPEAEVSAPVESSPEQDLATARRVMNGKALPRDPSATLALRDLWLGKAALDGAERREAEAILARPSDGFADSQGFGYTVPEQAPMCTARLCVHYVGSGTDAASPTWAQYNMNIMESVWATEVDAMRYRAPLTDGIKGGDARFDVYLKDLGVGLYGFCAPERRIKSTTASGYCVLDNDFAANQFPTGTPDGNLRVTAAHEFFHAIQFAYDYNEDRWMMEATATWMEERFATDVNDNLQYLPASQLYRPDVPLDLFSQTFSAQYGNWIFWEYLSTKYGESIVNKAWNKAGSLRRDGRKNSIGALQKVLKRKGGLTKVYAKFAAANLTPATTYPEGATYALPRVRGVKRLSKRKRNKRFKTKIDHLASASYVYAPGKGLSGKKWKLALNVSGPAKRTSPAAVVIVYLTNGRKLTKLVKLRRNGSGRLKVKFSKKKVGAVSVTLVNASTRYRCNKGTGFACGGVSRDDRARFAVRAKVVKR